MHLGTAIFQVSEDRCELPSFRCSWPISLSWDCNFASVVLVAIGGSESTWSTWPLEFYEESLETGFLDRASATRFPLPAQCLMFKSISCMPMAQ